MSLISGNGFPPPTLAKPLHLSRCNYKLVNKTRSTVRVKRDLIAEPPLQCYKNWKPIDATKFGYDISVRPPVRPYSPHDSGFIACSKISALENGFKKLRIRMPDSPDTCGRKPNPERKCCGFKNIRTRVTRPEYFVRACKLNLNSLKRLMIHGDF